MKKSRQPSIIRKTALLTALLLVGMTFSEPTTSSSSERSSLTKEERTNSELQLAPSGKGNNFSSRLLGVHLAPLEATLQGQNASQHFVLLGSYSDGLVRDLTARSQWFLSNPKIAKTESGGTIRALQDGQATLTAKFEGKVATARIQIEKSQDSRPLSFVDQISSVLTRRGCNSVECHGSVKGRGGFKLSKHALSPQEDYSWIMDGGGYQVLTAKPLEPRNPRIDLKQPEKSLLLLKPTMAVAHGGGERLPHDTADYQTVLNWITQGAPYEKLGAKSRIERVEVFPAEAVLKTKEQQQILVTAYFSDGAKRDLTDEVLYISGDEGIVRVDERGLAQGVKSGETTVIIHVAGHDSVSVHLGVVANIIQRYPRISRRNLIDDVVFEKLRKLSIIPSALSSDQEFLRRVCLDITGTLPPPERVREFLSSRDPQKRDKLIEALLESPEYVEYWTFRIGDIFRIGRDQGSQKFIESYQNWIRDSVVRDKPYDQLARERIAALGVSGASRHYYAGGNIRRPEDVMAEQARVFLGRRLDCAQCHDHPYESWSQNQFWGLAAFFGGVTQIGQMGAITDSVVFDDPEGHGELGQGPKVLQPRTKTEVQPTFLDGKQLRAQDMRHLRVKLAEWLTAQPAFAEAAVNRVWGYFLGRGIVEPVDDFRLVNPPTHPVLLKSLAESFRAHSHSLKYLMRLITQSRTYQLSGATNDTNRNDLINYSRSWPRALDPEVLLDAVSQITGVPELFIEQAGEGMLPPGTRAIQIIDPDHFPSYFLDANGRPDRSTVPVRKVKPNMLQALHLISGETFNLKLSKEGGRLDRLLKGGASNQQIVEQFYVSALSRLPTSEEMSRIQLLLQRSSLRRESIEDLLWAVVTSKEFAYNH